MKLPNGNSHQVFKTRRVRYARADELELYSSSTNYFISKAQTPTYAEVLLLFTHCRWMKTQAQPAMRYSKFVHYVQNQYRHLFLFFFFLFLKKNLNAPRPSEHPPVRGKKCQNV